MRSNRPSVWIARGLAVWLTAVSKAIAAEPVATPTGTAKWEPEIRAFEEADQTNPPPARPIVFIGSSSIRMWKGLADDFPGHPVINRGFGGSQIIDSVYFADRIATLYQPRMVFMYAGGNDLHGGKTPQQVLGDYRAFVAKLHSAVPDCSMVYISIAGNPSRWSEVDRVREANRLIRAYCATDKRLGFIDVFSAMLGEDGLPKADIFLPDRLHMNAKGYAIWRQIIEPRLPAPAPVPQ